ncbi:MAG TPA: DMT family transporter [Thermoanaerobacterales bacterium]|nr:DMT family transporter [Thermoanaerobacterales bacterium]
MRTKSEFLPILMGTLMSMIFGLSFFFTSEGLTKLSPIHLLSLRFLLSTSLFVILKMTKAIDVNLKGKNITPLLILSFFEPVLYFMFETTGIQLTSSSETGMFIALIPVFATILGILILNEKPTMPQVGFIILSVSGAIFMIVMKENVIIGSNLLGTALIFCGVISSSIYNTLSRRSSTQFNAFEITYVMMWCGAIVFGSMAVVQHLINGNLSEFFTPLRNANVLFSIFYLGGISSVFGYFLLNYILSKMEVARSSVFFNLVTVISIIAGVTFRNEPFYWFNVIGVIMILLGVWGTNYFKEDIEKEASEEINI